MDLFGPDFEKFDPEAEEESKPAPVASAPAVVGKATKGKLNAKSTGLKYQFQILEAIGIPRTDIKKFADAQHWLKYFPPQCIVSAPAQHFDFPLKSDFRKTTLPSVHVSTGEGHS